jgi:hypothetical protein
VAADPAPAPVPRTWQGFALRPLDDAGQARPLFDLAALPWPSAANPLLAWGAFRTAGEGDTLIGAVIAESTGRAGLLHGPVVTAEREALDLAAQLVGAIIDHATAGGVQTLFARPQGLDRLWVRFGFIPVPEGALPPALSTGPADGLYAWRGGSAVWSLRDAAAG